MEIRKDYSVSIDTGGEKFLLSPRYDFIRVWPKLGHAIINVVGEDGITTIHMPESEARRVYEASHIPLIELDWITDHDWDKYLEVQGRTEHLEEWLDGMEDKEG